MLYLCVFAGLAQEYCLTETFEASCDSSQVIVVDTANFGRMRLGKCVTKNYGFIGCFSNVLSILDSRCSGRQQCRFGVSDPAVGLLNTTPCPKDFASYLEATYTCQSGNYTYSFLLLCICLGGKLLKIS